MLTLDLSFAKKDNMRAAKLEYGCQESNPTSI